MCPNFPGNTAKDATKTPTFKICKGSYVFLLSKELLNETRDILHVSFVKLLYSYTLLDTFNKDVEDFRKQNSF